jgi:hypothetical protein
MDPTRLTPAEAEQIAANVKRGLEYTRRAAKNAHSLPDCGFAIDSMTVSIDQSIDLLVSYIRQQERVNAELTHQVALLGQRVLALESKP